MKIKKAAGKLLDFLYPPRCIFCGKMISSENFLCELCEGKYLVENESISIEIGRNYPKIECKVIYHYKNEIRQSVLDFKFHNRRENARLYAGKMNEMIMLSKNTLHIDCVTAVPLSKERKRERGYNQSDLIATELASLLHLPYHIVLKKVINNVEQHTLSMSERKENIQGVYCVFNKNKLEGKSILLVDDVLTTGFTLAECAKMLYDAGAETVTGIVVARSVLEEKKKEILP